jgi:hypothetical protein
LFVPGTPSSTAGWSEALQRCGARIENGMLRGDGLDTAPEIEWVENDGTFGQAFSFGTVGADVIEALEAAPGALVLYWPIDLRDGRQTIVTAVERLRAAGAIAVRLEQSKLGWEVSRWVELFSSISPWDWHRGAVTFHGGDGTLQSCGMHAFSLPDVSVPIDADEGELDELGSTLNVYQLTEDPMLRSGQTFRPDADTPRRVIERWPDTAYPAGHACHNPYGVWQLGPPGGIAREIGKLELVFMPALAALLTALERKRGRPLTRHDVEATRDQGACIAMEPRDAQKLERERGYRDIDPELAWEQWSLVRQLS